MLKAQTLHAPAMSVSFCDEPVTRIDTSPVTHNVRLRGVKTAKSAFQWATENTLPEGTKSDEMAPSTLI